MRKTKERKKIPYEISEDFLSKHFPGHSLRQWKSQRRMWTSKKLSRSSAWNVEEKFLQRHHTFPTTKKSRIFPDHLSFWNEENFPCRENFLLKPNNFCMQDNFNKHHNMKLLFDLENAYTIFLENTSRGFSGASGKFIAETTPFYVEKK